MRASLDNAELCYPIAVLAEAQSPGRQGHILDFLHERVVGFPAQAAFLSVW